MALPENLTLLLDDWRRGDRNAESKLFEAVYEELQSLASRYLRRERSDHTLEPTALVNEAYVRLVDERTRSWQNRAHFFALAARVMRNVLVDFARRSRSRKRGGDRAQVSLDEALVSENRLEEMLALDEVLDRLAAFDLRQCRIVELRCFAGLTNEETAAVLGIAPRAAKREWALAKSWLYGEIQERR